MSSQGFAKRRQQPFGTLVETLCGVRLVGDPSVRVSGLSYDSRTVKPGFAFIAVRGGQVDGHDFIADALARGAVALIVEDTPGDAPTPPPGGAIAVVPDTLAVMPEIARVFYDDPAARLTLAGVTGTNGKTTTALLMEAVFRAAGYRTGLIGTLEYRIAGRRLKAPHTTPQALDLHALFAEMVDDGVTHVAMEVSSHALELHRVTGCRFAAAVFTNLTQDHLDFHGTMEEYLAAKRQLFEDPQYLPEQHERVNAVNGDDPAGNMIAQHAPGQTLTYGLHSEARYRASDLAFSPSGTRFVITHPGGRTPVDMQLVGEFNVYNALGAFTASVGLGLTAEVVASAIGGMPPVRGRFERVSSPLRHVLVDYAHTPDGLQRALETARKATRGRVIVVFGCGGDRDRRKRPIMGEIASRLADAVVVTSDNPRREQPEAIIQEIVTGIPSDRRERWVVEADRATAIRLAIEQSGPDDLVLIAGKGHEDYQIIGDRTIHFDDREVAEKILRELEGPTGA